MDIQVQQTSKTTLKILSYNCLIQKYSFTSTVKNDPNWRNYSWRSRLEQLILKIVSESPDVVCLQEIRHVSQYQSPNFYDFYKPLYQMGFEGIFSRRNLEGEFGQQGLAIFFNKNNLYLVDTQAFYFNDTTGRNILGVTLRSKQGCLFKVATTHIIYPNHIELTEKQVKLTSKWPFISQTNIPCVVTGDFNLTRILDSHSNILKVFQDKFIDAHQKIGCRKSTFSLNLQGSNSPGMIPQLMGTKIDYIFVSKDIGVITADVIGDIKDLPTMSQPSDHLPILVVVQIPNVQATIQQSITKLIDVFKLVSNRDQNHDLKWKQFLQLFWYMPRKIKNTIYELTYSRAISLGIYEHNLQFGRVAFTNNSQHLQTYFDKQGNLKTIATNPIRNQLMPKQQIETILQIIWQQIIIIPMLIKKIKTMQIDQFLQLFDQKLDTSICNKIYGATYSISVLKDLPTHHLDYGKVSFRNVGGWKIQNDIRIMAMQTMELP